MPTKVIFLTIIQNYIQKIVLDLYIEALGHTGPLKNIKQTKIKVPIDMNSTVLLKHNVLLHWIIISTYNIIRVSMVSS